MITHTWKGNARVWAEQNPDLGKKIYIIIYTYVSGEEESWACDWAGQGVR